MRVADGPMDLNIDEELIARHLLVGPQKDENAHSLPEI